MCCCNWCQQNGFDGLLLNMQKQGNNLKQPIANFGAIKYKLAEMAIRIFASESALYRTSKWIDDKEVELAAAGKPFNEALLGAAEEYAVECAMLKSTWQ
jgi:alkylation response protein AidB-like acyl-CoA dehydrogenase